MFTQYIIRGLKTAMDGRPRDRLGESHNYNHVRGDKRD